MGNPDAVTILELAQEILALTAARVRRPDISRARQLLGWEPKVDRHEGLRGTLEYFRNRVHNSR